MRSIRPTLACAMLLALAACDITGSGHPLTISGTVRSAATAAPIAGARVEIYSNPFIGEGYRMKTVETDAQGRYTARIEEQRSYAEPNCAAMALWVTAHGYAAGGPANGRPGIGSEQDPLCESGTVTVDVSLTPLP